MPTEHISISYKFSELDDHAQEKAVDAIAEKLGGDWWDENDIENVRESISYTFAEKVGFPGLGEWKGEGGSMDNVKLSGWDLGRGQNLELDGILSRDNAPGLPWHEHADEVVLKSSNYGTSVDVTAVEGLPFTCAVCGDSAVSYLTYDGSYLAAHDTDDHNHDAVARGELPRFNQAALDELGQAVRNAMGEAMASGTETMEYASSEENAREWIDNNDPDFRKDGNLF